jgi:spore germination cell wall hydrolase CwlJ-like protein
VKKLFMVVVGMFSVLVGSVSAVSEANLPQNIVARTILAEAKNQGTNGMYAVACVIQQRAIDRGLSAEEVCLQRRQFSCWNKANANDKGFKALPNSWQAKYANDLAANIIAGKALDRSVVGFANHYCRVDCDPSWVKFAKLTATVGDHRFFRL